jgi:uncharacterized membrane protein YecN with MAPEG domain
MPPIPATPVSPAPYRSVSTRLAVPYARTADSRAADRIRIRITLLGLIAFAAGLGAPWKINLVGEIFVAELVLLALMVLVAPMALRTVGSSRTFWILLTAAALTMLGYIMSDMVRGTSEAQYLRGWARNLIVITSMMALIGLAAKDTRNIWWFLVGVSIGSIAWFELVQGLHVRSTEFWKFNYATPVTILLACSAAFLPRKAVSVLFVLLGAYSATQDFRIHGATCVLAGVILWHLDATDPRKALRTILKVGTLTVIGVVGALLVVSFTSNVYTEQRRATSNVGRLLAIQVGVAAIANSPVIGYGSWPTDPELVSISRAVTQRYAEQTGRSVGDVIYTNAHSQILNSWMEGGVLGATLYIVLFVIMIRAGILVTTRQPPDFLTPVLLFLLITQVWNLLMSPLGSSGRLLFATTAALSVIVLLRSNSSGKTTRHYGMVAGALRGTNNPSR